MKKGFTLIEMLIVIAIIAILSSVFLVGLRGFREGAYDSRRLADLQKVQSYLEIYYTKNRRYPDNGDWNSLGIAIKGVGISVIPNDPISGNNYYYGVSGDKQGYMLGAAVTAGNSIYSENTAITNCLSQIGEACYNNIPCGDGTQNTVFCIKF